MSQAPDTPSASAGSCLCGGVRFRVRLPSRWMAHCHCTRCQRAHGAAFVTWVGLDADGVQWDSPEGLLRWFQAAPEDGGGERAHCGRCGSPMAFRAARWPGELHLPRALFTTPLDREPRAHGFYETHVDWVQLGDQLPRRSG